MSRSNIGTQRVPFEVPKKPYKLLCVGEAPGGEEEGQGRPFVGRSGQLLTRYLERNGLERPEVGLANLSEYRPRGNKFFHLLDTPQLEDGLNKLEAVIKRDKPNCILALGGWPMWFLTGKCGSVKNSPKPGSGILDYRGSRVPALERFGETKVFCTTHPSFIERVWEWNPVFNIDIAHAVEDSRFPELRYPEYEKYIDPPPDVLNMLVEESVQAELCAVDIETWKGRRCVGWAWEYNGKLKAVTVTEHAQHLWIYSKRMWESDVPKVFQYGTYDVPYMRKFFGWKVGGYYGGKGWDTYVATANILPDFPRGLDFLNSIYTRIPYYKDEGGSIDLQTRWHYNLKDCVATLLIAQEQMKEILVLFARSA